MLDLSQDYTFSQYFELQIPADELITALGYTYERVTLSVPSTEGDRKAYPARLQDLDQILKLTRTSNEQTKREVLVAPIVQTLVLETHALLRVEYPLYVSPLLHGTLDYLISKDGWQHLLVIEAKRNDLDYGFTQLAAQMIALDQWEQAPSLVNQPVLTGAVTTGETWKFGQLDRRTKALVESINLLTVPDEALVVLNWLSQGLAGAPSQPTHPDTTH